MNQCLRIVLFTAILATSAAAAPQLNPQQQAATDRIAGKGGLVLQVAADSDALVVNLSLAGKGATDEVLGDVKGLPKVAQLNLAGTAITDAGLANLAALSELSQLHLERTAITDAGLAHLKSLAKLEYLNLHNTAVTDRGLAHLSGLKNLKRVFLWQTKVTDAGAAALKKALPDIVINRGEELAIIATIKPHAGPQPVNTCCPVLGKPVNPAFTFTYEGKLVAFCCTKCCGQFAKEPKKFADKIKCDAVPAEKPAEKKPEEKKPAEKVAVNSKCPVSGSAVDAKVTFDYEGKTVAFCCKNCCAKFAKEPAKYAANVK